jgi:uncharacterized small protein (TIGR04563 family)
VTPKRRRKLSVYLPWPELKEMDAEAKRLRRSVSYVLRRAWKLARDEVRQLPRRPWPPTTEQGR